MRKRYIGIPGGGWAEMEEKPVSTGPMVMPDITPYQNMVDGKMINSRSEHRAFLKANNLIEVGNETKYLTPKPKQLPGGLRERIAEIAAEKLRYR